jgi:putative ATPase
MVNAGEDPEFIARRLLILAAEDIGLANPNALLLANACFDALKKIGWPEGRIILAETTVYLACCPKSNSAYMAINDAIALVNETGDLPVPLHLRNAPTQLLKTLDYGKNYLYAHDFPDHFIKQQFRPDQVQHRPLWTAQNNPAESKMSDLQKQRWGTSKTSPSSSPSP